LPTQRAHEEGDAVEKLAVYVDTLPSDRKVVPISERKASS
jgi:hypothetical protein